MRKKPTRKRPYFKMESAMTAILRDASGKMHHGTLFDPLWVLRLLNSINKFLFCAETKSRKTDSNPPEVDVALLTNKELPKTSKRLDLEQLPIDILLLTVKDCEFLACVSRLTGFSRMFQKELGDVYIGNIGEMKIAVMKCRMGGAGPGSAAGVVRDAVKALTPKAV